MPGVDHYHMIVVGGGIHGVGVAQAAAAAGYRVLLLEQQVLGAGTSSRSSKLIHGGLRYLETAQFSLVRESLREREILLRIAPELVHRLPFYIPVYAHTRRRPWQIRAGLSLYAVLAGLGPYTGFQSLPPARWSQLDGLDTRGLQAVFRYWDAQTDDARLTRAVMASARELGADLACPARFSGAVREAEGFTVSYRSAEGEQQRHCRTLVNAAGPWVNQVLSRIRPATRQRPVDLVQGTHILLDAPAPRGAYYVEAPRDRRAVFVLPWREQTLVGTTEHVYEGDPAKVAPLPEEIEYLQETLHRYFPEHKGALCDSFAGLRVLPRARGPAFYRPRETILHRDPRHPGLLSIYGGKLTAYRATAEKVLRRLAGVLPPPRPVARTDRLRLSLNEVTSS